MTTQISNSQHTVMARFQNLLLGTICAENCYKFRVVTKKLFFVFFDNAGVCLYVGVGDVRSIKDAITVVEVIIRLLIITTIAIVIIIITDAEELLLPPYTHNGTLFALRRDAREEIRINRYAAAVHHKSTSTKRTRS